MQVVLRQLSPPGHSLAVGPVAFTPLPRGVVLPDVLWELSLTWPCPQQRS